MTKETIYYQISGTGVAISGLHPKHKKTELNLTNAEFALIRDIMRTLDTVRLLIYYARRL